MKYVNLVLLSITTSWRCVLPSATPAEKRREVIAEFKYPPLPIQGVPLVSDSVEIKRAYCAANFPQYLKPVGPGMSDKSVESLCYLHRLVNRPEAWPREFNNWADAWTHWKIATAILEIEGYDIQQNLTGIKFGDNPGWIIQPNTELILCTEKIPKDASSLDQLLAAVVKSVRGKSSDATETSVVDGPTSVPIALQHHNLAVIPKGSEFQVVYDAKSPSGRIVHLSRNIIIRSSIDGSFSVQLLQPDSADLELMESLNRPFNSLLPSKSTFRASAVDYTNSKDFRQYLRKWGAAARLAWIDCSSACRGPWPRSFAQTVCSAACSAADLASVVWWVQLKLCCRGIIMARHRHPFRYSLGSTARGCVHGLATRWHVLSYVVIQFWIGTFVFIFSGTHECCGFAG